MRDDGPLDEMVDGSGHFRTHWRRILDPIFGLGADELAERSRLLARAFADEGFTSVLPGARSVSWNCDPIPLPISGHEFAGLEEGLAQRARLLETILQDIYGPQNLLAEGALPPSLVYANPAFLRPCRSTENGRDAPLLQTYAADLIRGPDGAWRVLADRTSGAAGAAYALENRRMLSRIFPEVFRTQEIWQVSTFFEIWQDALQRMAGGSANPNVALLTAGHTDPAWFEHVLLSRELSCALVEGRDLTVRGGRVFLKTLRGLQPVDVLVRRTSGADVDPLELGSSLGRGVPGLLDAARGGTVRIVNDPGAALAESPGLAAFLPDLALRMLGEKLRLPGVLTLWLGDERAREVVTGDLGSWLIRPALDGGSAPLPVARMEGGEEKLAARIAEMPRHFAAIATIPPSVAPCVGASGVEPRSIVLRMFMVFDGAEWRAMRGGLARHVSEADVLAGRLPLQALSKDVWVLVDEEARIVGPGQVVVPPLAIRRTPADLPARIASDFFWLGRTLERLERAARLERATIARLNRPVPMPRERAELHILLGCLIHGGFVDEESVQGASVASLSEALLRTVGEQGPVFKLLGRVASLTEQLRDRLTGEMYATVMQSLRTVGEEFHKASAGAEGRHVEGLSHAMGGVLRFAATVAGLSAENMVRVGGRLFMDLGRRLERAEAIAAELAFALAPQGAATQPGHIEAGLKLALELRDSAITYRSRYCTVVQPAPALDLVLADEDNPRALAYQLIAARDLLSEIAGGSSTPMARGVSDLLDETHAIVRDVARSQDQAVAAAQLPPRLRAIQQRTAALAERIIRQYFELLPVAHAVGLETDASRTRGAA